MTWCGDISYISTWEGFLYLGFVEDLASRRILGLSMANHIYVPYWWVTPLPKRSVSAAVTWPGWCSTPTGAPSTPLAEFAELCERHGIVQSVGRTGVCWNNAPAESFLATLKKELIYRRTFRTRAEARVAIRHWIEAWYNRRRLQLRARLPIPDRMGGPLPSHHQHPGRITKVSGQRGELQSKGSTASWCPHIG